jgi:general secretion pathway protein J
MSSRKSNRGFTLLEILVAVFIIGIIAIIMVRGLQIVITTKNSLERNETQLQQLDLTMSLLSGDLRNLINRPITLSNGETQVPLILHDDAQQSLEFTRGGVSNPLAELRSNLQHNEYELRNNELIRLTWPVLDQVAASKPMERLLLKQVTYLQWQFLGEDNRFYTGWPATGAANQALPTAVKVTMTITGLGTLTRLFIVGNANPPVSSPEPLAKSD